MALGTSTYVSYPLPGLDQLSRLGVQSLALVARSSDSVDKLIKRVIATWTPKDRRVFALGDSSRGFGPLLYIHFVL